MDILDIKKGIIAHQVNCQKKAGAGLALQIRNKYSEWYLHFINTIPYLGLLDIYYINPDLKIASLYAQDKYGYGKIYTDYEALGICLKKLHDATNDTVYFPYKMGCGYGGGNWNIVNRLIENYFNPFEYKIVKKIK